VGVTEEELRKLRWYYSSLLGRKEEADSVAGVKWATISYFRSGALDGLAEEIRHIEADFPGLVPPFRLKDFRSQASYRSAEADYYDMSGIRSYLATAVGKVKAELDAANEAPEAPHSLERLPGKSPLLSETERMLKRGGMVSVLFIDLDEFKRVNDTQGHAVGDECLEAVVKITAEAIFHKGKLYRWGGDEFVVVLPNFEVSEATATAERIRQAIARANLVSGVGVTASVGVASCCESGGWTAASLLDAADQAMYRSKDAGRNRVTVHEPAIGDERVSKAKLIPHVAAAELARRAEAAELSMSLRQAVSGNYMALVRNESDEEVSVGKISLERNGIELSQPGRPKQGEGWIIAPRSERAVTWAPVPDPVGTLAMTQPSPTSPVDIEMVVHYEVLERRKVAKRKILVAVDYRNHRMDQFSP
jgi:diguanylate cyclase (GGDEF)-like protein